MILIKNTGRINNITVAVFYSYFNPGLYQIKRSGRKIMAGFIVSYSYIYTNYLFRY